MRPHLLVIILILSLLGFQKNLFAQNHRQIRWLTFEQLEDSLAQKPKKVFIDFYTDWCTYCRKMDQAVFTKTEVIQALNQGYYAVRMDAETRDTIRFDGQTFMNRQAHGREKGIHELAFLLGQRDGQFIPPTMLVLDEKFRVRERVFEYLSSKDLLKILIK